MTPSNRCNRLRGLREVLELSAREVQRLRHLPVEEYMALGERRKRDISVNICEHSPPLQESQPGCAAMFGENLKMNA